MAKKPRINSLLDDVANKVTQPQGIRAYHGSPHDFDRFDLSKIGTGEGAQAYGHGLYFAEKEGIADTYRRQLSGPDQARWISANGQPLDLAELARIDPKAHQGALEFHVRQAYRDPNDVAKIRDELQRTIKNYESGYIPMDQRGLDDARSALHFIENYNAGIIPEKRAGRMYEVNIRANPEDFLDWDKPLDRGLPQNFRDAFNFIANSRPDIKEKFYEAYQTQQPGSIYYSILNDAAKTGDITKNQAAATESLRQAGIPGIKYLDAGSRSAGDGSRNYVVFDDALIDIIRKYGIVPGGLLGAGYAMAPSNAEAAPSRPDWIGNDGAITGNPPWLRPDPNERGTLGKLWDAVTTNPTGTAKAVGGALTDAAKDYAKSVYADPSKGAADALELGVTAMGGAIPQAFWMAGSPDAANAGEDAILAQRRKMMQGLLAD